jgi:hypothetical protein
LCEQAVDLDEVRHLAGVECAERLLENTLIRVLEDGIGGDVRLRLEGVDQSIQRLAVASAHRVPNGEVLVVDRLCVGTTATAATGPSKTAC